MADFYVPSLIGVHCLLLSETVFSFQTYVVRAGCRELAGYARRHPRLVGCYGRSLSYGSPARHMSVGCLVEETPIPGVLSGKGRVVSVGTARAR